MKLVLVACFIAIALCCTAQSDTIFKFSGEKLAGKITLVNDQTIIL